MTDDATPPPISDEPARRNPPASRRPDPAVTTASVVVVTMDDPRVLDCLASLIDQDPPFEYEVHLVGEWTQDEIPRRIDERFGDEARLTVSRTTAPFMDAWNGAARATEGPIVVRMDSDTRAEPGWLEAIVSPLLEDDRLGWTAGKVLGPEEPRSLTQRYFTQRSVGFFERQADAGREVTSAPGWNVAYRRSALEAVGWYDEALVSSEDWDLHKRLTDAGHPGRLVPQAVLRHDHPDTVRELVDKEIWYKTGQIQIAHKHGLSEIWPVFQIPLAYALVAGLLAAGVVLAPLALAGLVLWLGLAVKHWIGAVREDDDVWWARPFFRVLEAVGGLFGLARGLTRYGVPPWQAPPTGPVREPNVHPDRPG